MSNVPSPSRKMHDILHDHQAIFRCPICARPMELVEHKSLVCVNRHCFDLAKHGYVNFLSHAVKSKYTKPLFEARRRLAQSGFFEPLNQQISQKIYEEYTKKQRQLKLLDAGCGEGSHLERITALVNEQAQNREAVLGVGMDLAKEGIMIAAKAHKEALWCVADLAHCPFHDHRFDIILNILSPSNYGEFQRLLTGDGLVLKVIPERDYLKQLRELLYDNSPRQTYSNDKTLELFEQHLKLVSSQTIRYEVELDQSLIEDLVRMTPLAWRAEPERIEKILNHDRLEITVDLTLLIGSTE